jgi:hypothetical protein
MEQFKKLGKVLSEIKKVSQKIIQNSIALMKTISADGELVDLVLEEVPTSGRIDALAALQNVSLAWTKDAEAVLSEIDRFMVFEDGTYRVNVEGCPLLAQAWCGDLFDKSEYDGMVALLEDLKEQRSTVTEDKLVSDAVASIKKSEDSAESV